MSKSWCYSFDDSNFLSGTFNTRKAALEDAQKEGIARNNDEGNNNIKCIYVAECKLAVNEELFPDAETIIEHMECMAQDAGGEHGSDYPDVTKEQKEDLTSQLHKLLNEWCEKCDVTPSFYTVFESKKHDLITLKSVE